MTLDSLAPAGSQVIVLSDRWHVFIQAARQAHPSLDVLWFLGALSGDFWFLSALLGRVVLVVHDALDESLGALLAVAYNIALAVAFSAALASSIIIERAGSDYFYHYQAAGFAFAYVVLGAVYAERSGEISEYAILGYAAGLVAYLAFCIHSSLVHLPWAGRLYVVMRWAVHGWPGKVSAAFSLVQGAIFAWHAVQRRMRGPTWRFRKAVFF